MVDRFKKHLETTGIIQQTDRVLVGYSGGADSTCLLVLLKEAGIDVVAAHLHHGQRDEAEKELKLCQAFAESLNIPFISGRAQVPQMAQDMGIGLEEAGRHARYGFFEQGARSVECNLIATAHTRSDHVETVLLNLTRGSGMQGLTGIPAQRGNVVRPLLPFSRDETRKFCEDRGLWFHDDPANTDINFSRARVRHRVLPELISINPSVETTISRMASLIDEEDRFLNGAAAAALEQSEIQLNGPLWFLTKDVEVAFSRSKLSGLPAVLFKRAIRLAVETLGGSLDRHQTVLILEGVVEKDNGAITCEGGSVAVEWDANRIMARQIRPTIPYRYSLTLPGETISEEFGWQFTAFDAPASESKPVRASLAVELNKANVKGSLYFRTVQAGDTIRPLGFDGTRKISDLLSELKLTSGARSRIPLVCDMLGPIWVPGVCLDERARTNNESTGVIVIRFEPLGN